jgi:hypothetical protein
MNIMEKCMLAGGGKVGISPLHFFGENLSTKYCGGKKDTYQMLTMDKS